MKKFCTKCGHEFESVGREVICPSCKQTAAEETRRAAVLRAKRASWTGESVPVRISGRASTVIREFGAANGLPFAESLDALLKASSFFQTMGKAWENIVPYRSHRRDKHTAQDTAQDTAHEIKTASKASTAASKASASKPQAAKASKASKAKASTAKASK